MPTDTVAKRIEDIFTTSMARIDGLTVLRFEPNELDRLKMPMLTMAMLMPQSSTTETGGGETVDYRWEISLYISLEDYETAQADMRDVAWDVIAQFREDRGDYMGVEGVTICEKELTRRNAPGVGGDGAWMRGSWELRVQTDERP